MKNIFASVLVLLLVATTASAGPYYVRYFKDDGRVNEYAVDFPFSSYRMAPDGRSFYGFPDSTRAQGLFSTTYDAAPSSGRTNISQFADAVVLEHPYDDYIQASKSDVVKACENKFLMVCEQLTGSRDKLGFDELGLLVGEVGQTNFVAGQMLFNNLTYINQYLLRESSPQWWDTCVWHSDVTVEMIERMDSDKLKAAKAKGLKKEKGGKK